MSLKQRLTQDLKEAMKSKDVERRDAIRSLQAAIKQVEIDKRVELDDDGVVKVLMSEAKKQREAIEAFEAGGRGDEIDEERQRLVMIESYLPAQMSREELEKLAKDVIGEVGATSMKDMGKVMSIMMKKVQGQADGSAISEVVRSLLG